MAPSDSFPELVVGDAVSRSNASPRLGEQQPLQIVVILGRQQYRGGLAVARYNDRALVLAFVHISTEMSFHVCQGCDLHNSNSSPPIKQPVAFFHPDRQDRDSRFGMIDVVKDTK
jgi:hypothetical protein